jgi:glucosamine-6-phosphate deaminase
MKRKQLEVEKLTVRVFDTRKEMGKAAAEDAEQRITCIIDEKGEAVIVFAAAPSQNELLAELKKADIDWRKVRAMHMDEYIGLPEDHEAGFGQFLRRAIFDELPLKEIHYLFDAQASPQEICDHYSALLKEYPPDLVLLGVGENGHLAFNNPDVADFEDPESVKIVVLDDVCRTQQVNDGCFETIDDVPEKAITLTMSALLSIKDAIAVVPGKTKARAIDRMLNGEISANCPASILRTKEKAALYLDVESAAKAFTLYS